ncbi:MAG TPA: immunity 26/phosphotriesterase HocA family protein [Pseudonocardiaceae bacterium]
MKVKYREGDWFAVPLRDNGYAVGVVARANKDGILLGYFFGPRRLELPQLTDVRDMTKAQAILVGRFGDLHLIQGKWPILGRLHDWHRDDWPMPVFVRYEELTGRSFRVYYDDDDPNNVPREEQIPPGVAEQGPKDRMMGAGFVERVLTKILQ